MNFVTINEAAELLATDRAVIRGLMKAHAQPYHPVRRSGQAKGISMDSLRILARALGQTTPTRAQIERVINSPQLA